MDYQTFADTYFGGNASAIAREFNLQPSAVAYWKKRGTIPELRAAQMKLWIIEHSPAPAKAAPDSPTEPVGALPPA